MSRSKTGSPYGGQERSEQRKSSLSMLFKNNEVFLINLVCPDNSIMSKVHYVKETFQDIISDTCRNLRIELPELFGIAAYEHNEYRFLSERKTLMKILPQCLVVTHEQASQLNGIETRMFLDSTIKSSRLYLRMKHFYVNIDQLPERTLHFCYEQVRLDTLKYQNWFSLQGYDDVLMDIATKCLYLVYQSNAVAKVTDDPTVIKRYLPLVTNVESRVTPIINLLKKLDENMREDPDVDDQPDTEVSEESSMKSNDSEEQNIISGNKADQFLSPYKSNHNGIDGLIKELSVTDSKIFRNDLMTVILKEALKLPFFGMYFYQVDMIQDDRNILPNCRIGIGPLGISVYNSRDYTTWSEIESWGWRGIQEINFQKNILQLFDVGSPQAVCRSFQCTSEHDAKYLFRHCRQIQQFQSSTLQEVKSRRNAKRESGARRKGSSVVAFFSHGRNSFAGLSPSKPAERRNSDSSDPPMLHEVTEEDIVNETGNRNAIL